MNLFGRTFAITGTLSVSREKFTKLLEARGAKVVGSVGRGIEIIVGKNPGSKLEKARSLGLKEWTEADIVGSVEEVAKRPRGGYEQKVYGASDDLIELSGCVDDELVPDEKGTYIRFSNGTQVKVRYAEDGCWRLEVVDGGDTLSIKRLYGIPDDAELIPPSQCHGDEEADYYSDVIIFKTDEPVTLVGWGARPIPEPSPGHKQAKKIIDLICQREGDDWWHYHCIDNQNEILQEISKIIEEKP